jgi:hypothetical protein
MRLIRRSALGAAVAISVSALGAPMASAEFWPGPTNAVGQLNGPAGCQADFPAGVGFAGGTTANNCGAVASFTGPADGEVANVTGPVITGAAVLAPVVVTAGPASY